MTPQSEVTMNYTNAEKIRLLEGENDAAEAFASMVKIALENKIIVQENVQQDLLSAVESWFALREQRKQAETSDNPTHIFN